MRQPSFRRLRPALAVLGAVAVFTGCARDEQSPLAGNPGADLQVGVELSRADAAPGEQIAVAVGTRGMELGGLQGTLRYDARKLSYVGQAPEGSMLTIVNDSRAAQGEIRTISFRPGNPLGPRAGALVFAVKGAEYAASLRYDMELATDPGANKEITKYRALATSVAAGLAVPAGARPMSAKDWTDALFPETAGEELFPKQHYAGQYLANLRYGNANLSAESPSSCTSVNILDAAYVANIAVGNNSVLAVDFPGRDPVVAGNVRPASSPIPGINGNGTRSIDILDAAAIGNEAVGNNQTIVCDLIPGREPVPSTIVTLTGNLTTTRTLTRDTLYRVDGIYRVNGGGKLVVMPGTRIEGRFTSTSGLPSAIYIERDGLIDAQGTQLQPIVFTCDQTPKFKGCWGGLVIAGSGSINGGQGSAANTSATSPVIAGRAASGGCLEQDYEGSAGASLLRFGGCNDADSSGVVKYARFEYGGYVFASNKEINNLTLGGVGSRTVFDFIQVHGGSDDGLEIFGGALNVKHLVATGNSDDSFDYSQGWSGKAQFIIVQQDSLDSDKGFEIDNGEAAGTFNNLPRVNAQVYNVTMVGELDPTSTSGTAGNNVGGGIHLRRGAWPDHYNFIMMGYQWLLNIDDNETCPAGADLKTEVHLESVTAFDFTRIDDPANEGICQPYPSNTSIEDDFFNDGQNNIVSATNPLIAPFNVITPDFRPVSAAVVSGAVTPPNDGYFDNTATYRGAVAAGVSIPWYAGWTITFQNNTTP